MNAIEVSGLAKKYGRSEALRDVDLSVGRGEVFGLVGPNGAGKTTLIKGLVGALRPSGGGVLVMGLNPLKDRAEVRQRIGYMPQGPALYEDLTARGNVGFFGAAHRTPDLKKKVDEVMHFADLLAIASVMLGIFISTFARHEGQVFPFVPLIILPSVFLSGLLVDVDELLTWADWLGHALSPFWANDVIQDVIESGWTCRGASPCS